MREKEKKGHILPQARSNEGKKENVSSYIYMMQLNCNSNTNETRKWRWIRMEKKTFGPRLLLTPESHETKKEKNV